jgi:hypothetical protein
VSSVSIVAILFSFPDVQKNISRKPEGMRPRGRPKCRRENNIKIGVKEVGKCKLGLTGTRDGIAWTL